MDCPEGKALLVSEDPFRDYNRLARKFRDTRLDPEADRVRHYTTGKNTDIAADAGWGE